MVTIAHEPSCPYVNCNENHPRRVPRCPACQERLLWCEGCKTANRADASFCRQCGELIVARDEWRLPGGNLQRTGYLPLRSRLPEAAPAPRARVSLGTWVEAGLIAAFDRLIVTTTRGIHILHASDLRSLTGNFPLVPKGGGELIHTPAIAGGILYAVSQTGYAAWDLRPMLKGNPPAELWNEAGGPFLGSPLPVGDWVYMPGLQGVLAVKSRDEKAQVIDGPTRALVLHEGLIVAAPHDNTLVALDREGRQVWTKDLLTMSRKPLEIDDDAGLVSDGDSIRFADEDGWLYQCYRDTGASKTAKGPQNPSGLSVGPGGALYVSSQSGLVALGRSGQRWYYDHESVETAAIVLDGLVLAGTTNGHLLMVDSETGVAMTSRVGIGGSAVRGLAVHGAMVAAVTSDGDVATFDLPLEEEKS